MQTLFFFPLVFISNRQKPPVRPMSTLHYYQSITCTTKSSLHINVNAFSQNPPTKSALSAKGYSNPSPLPPQSGLTEKKNAGMVQPPTSPNNCRDGAGSCYACRHRARGRLLHFIPSKTAFTTLDILHYQSVQQHI